MQIDKTKVDKIPQKMLPIQKTQPNTETLQKQCTKKTKQTQPRNAANCTEHNINEIQDNRGFQVTLKK